MAFTVTICNLNPYERFWTDVLDSILHNKSSKHLSREYGFKELCTFQKSSNLHHRSCSGSSLSWLNTLLRHLMLFFLRILYLSLPLLLSFTVQYCSHIPSSSLFFFSIALNLCLPFLLLFIPIFLTSFIPFSHVPLSIFLPHSLFPHY